MCWGPKPNHEAWELGIPSRPAPLPRGPFAHSKNDSENVTKKLTEIDLKWSSKLVFLGVRKISNKYAKEASEIIAFKHLKNISFRSILATNTLCNVASKRLPLGLPSPPQNLPKNYSETTKQNNI